jgi:hypothetical protein
MGCTGATSASVTNALEKSSKHRTCQHCKLAGLKSRAQGAAQSPNAFLALEPLRVT